MIHADSFLELGLAFHGHKCPAMPLGLRAGAAAMNRLGVERAPDGQLAALIELGEGHCGTCFADGVQVITGCTFGKGNIRKLDYGKWAVTLIDKKTGRSVRVSVKAETMAGNKKTEFMQNYRQKGVPASQVPAEVVDPLIAKVLAAPEERLFAVGEVVNHPWTEPVPSFESFVCERCGEMVAEPYGRLRQGKMVCVPCQTKTG
jgi:formylmethanofuran dehydrogenase subunit E